MSRHRDETRLLVVGAPGLLADMVASVLQGACPGVCVETMDEGDIGAGVEVREQASSRWMFIEAAQAPSADSARALADGASAALTLASSHSDLVQALRALLSESHSYVAPEIVAWMATESLGRRFSIAGDVRLTSREREVLGLVAAGLSTSAMATSMGISVNTVRSHLHALSVKLEAGSRTKMVATARALDLLNATPAAGQLAGA